MVLNTSHWLVLACLAWSAVTLYVVPVDRKLFLSNSWVSLQRECYATFDYETTKLWNNINNANFNRKARFVLSGRSGQALEETQFEPGTLVVKLKLTRWYLTTWFPNQCLRRNISPQNHWLERVNDLLGTIIFCSEPMQAGLTVWLRVWNFENMSVEKSEFFWERKGVKWEWNEKGRHRDRRAQASKKPNKMLKILSDLNQALPNHLTDESRMREPDTPPDHPPGWCIRRTHLTLVLEKIRYCLVQIDKTFKKNVKLFVKHE